MLFWSDFGLFFFFFKQLRIGFLKKVGRRNTITFLKGFSLELDERGHKSTSFLASLLQQLYQFHTNVSSFQAKNCN